MIDIVSAVPEENDKRRVSLPIWDEKYAWWTEAVRAKIRPRNPNGPDQKTLAEKFDLSASEVSRAINREKPLYDIVIAISGELGVPSPVILPESEAEARELAKQLRLFRSDRQLEQIRGGDSGSGPPPIAQSPQRRKPKRKGKQPRT